MGQFIPSETRCRVRRAINMALSNFIITCFIFISAKTLPANLKLLFFPENYSIDSFNT